MSFKFIVPGKVRGKQRAGRVTKTGHHYNPPQTASVEGVIKLFARQAGCVISDKPIALDVIAVKAIPKSFSKSKRIDALAGKTFPITKPDFDNIGKLVGDALNWIAYEDDRQIVDG